MSEVKTLALDAMKAKGAADAAGLRGRAAELDGTALIAEEVRIPAFDPEKDYSGWPAGAPVRDGGQVWTLLQPHNAAHYSGRPAELRALWGLAHTKDPERAKEFVAPLGTSGLYMQGECCVFEGSVWRCLTDSTAYRPGEHAQSWEETV